MTKANDKTKRMEGQILKKTLAFMFSLLLLTGCQSNEEKPLAEQGSNDHVLQIENSDPTEEKETATNQEIAKHLAHVANSVPNVNEATAIIAGPYAVVGIDVDKDLDRSRVGTIKYAVTEALHDDPYGKTAVVVADADGTQRIRNMAQGFQDGDPVQQIIEELSAVVGRYMPETPPLNKHKNEPNTAEEGVSEQEEKELEDVQEKQSNHHLNKNGE